MMRTEFDRLQQRLPMETMSMKRYELPPPPAGKLTDMSAWNECLENSMAQLEHQATRYVYYYFLVGNRVARNFFLSRSVILI